MARRIPERGRQEVDARGLAVAPGFINMLSWATESLIEDGRGQSDIRQGVTLEVMGEGWSMGPLNEEMRRLSISRQSDIRYPIPWTTLGEYLEHLQQRGISPNVASFVGAATVRIHELGEGDVDPTPAQLARMRALVRQAMNEGAMGVGSSLIYAPGNFAETDELVALAARPGAAAACISATCVRGRPHPPVGRRADRDRAALGRARGNLPSQIFGAGKLGPL